MQDLVLFIDFDGVTHPYRFEGREDTFSHKETFENLVRKLQENFNVKIVVSSCFTAFNPLEFFKTKLSKDIADLIIDESVRFPTESGNKLKEAKYWIKTNAYKGKWLAIGTNVFAWNAKSFDEHPQVVFVDNLFNEEDAIKLLEKAQKYIKKTKTQK